MKKFRPLVMFGILHFELHIVLTLKLTLLWRHVNKRVMSATMRSLS